MRQPVDPIELLNHPAAPEQSRPQAQPQRHIALRVNFYRARPPHKGRSSKTRPAFRPGDAHAQRIYHPTTAARDKPAFPDHPKSASPEMPFLPQVSLQVTRVQLGLTRQEPSQPQERVRVGPVSYEQTTDSLRPYELLPDSPDVSSSEPSFGFAGFNFSVCIR